MAQVDQVPGGQVAAVPVGRADDLDGARDQVTHLVGRDPSTIERSAGVENASGASTDALIANAEELVALGISLLTVGVNGPDYDLSAAEALCRWRDARA